MYGLATIHVHVTQTTARPDKRHIVPKKLENGQPKKLRKKLRGVDLRLWTIL